MLKLLIADDEHNICKLINNLIDWSALGAELIGFSSDGSECLSMIHAHNPDIVITDIRMPGMSGLELIRQCIERGFRTRFIIVSGYAQFDYAYSAIKYGVSDFLMKPINGEELNEALRRVADQIRGVEPGREAPEPSRAEPADSQASRGSLLFSLLHRDFSPGDYSLESINSELGFRFRDGLLLPGAIMLENVHSVRTNLNYIMDQTHKIFDKEVLSLCYDCATLKKRNMMMFLINFDPSNANEVQIAVQYAFDSIQNMASSHAFFNAVMGIGNTVRGLEDIQLSFDRALCAVESRAVLGHDSIINGSDLDTRFINSDLISVEEPNRALSPLLEILDIERAVPVIASEYRRQMPDTSVYPYCVFSYSKKYFNTLIRDIGRYHALPDATDDMISATHERIENSPCIGDIEAYISKISENLLKQIQESSPDIKTIRIAKSYIDQHFGEKLELEDVAKKVYLSPAYLGILFKRETGVNFSEYLTGVRIEKSKQMLRDVRYNISEIAAIVGYKDSRYFSKLFRKNVGVNPHDYRKLFYNAPREVI